MRHVPHLVVAPPWDDSDLQLSPMQWRHLTKVLRMSRGDRLTYTDGAGRVGEGRLGSQHVERGQEEDIPRPSNLTVAAAPPSDRNRQRYLVEKLAELGVARLVWLRTRHGGERIAGESKLIGWVLAAVEQSHGAWLMEASTHLTEIGALDGRLVVCHPGGSTVTPKGVDTVLIGPEGGFADDELPEGMTIWDLGRTVLRVETAAVVAAARLLGLG